MLTYYNSYKYANLILKIKLTVEASIAPSTGDSSRVTIGVSWKHHNLSTKVIKLYVVQWNLSIMVTHGLKIFGLIRGVAGINWQFL